MIQSDNSDLNEANPLEAASEEAKIVVENMEVPMSVEELSSSEEHDPEDAFEKGHDKAHNAYLDELMKELEQFTDPEMKLQRAIDFMEKSLAQNGSPHFKSFWQARDICLQLFKENLTPAGRTVLWAKYSDLSKEARRLKTLLDEQSAFAVEQIEIAVQALETAIGQLEDPQLLEGLTAPLLNCRALQHRLPYYTKLQLELDLLNTHATRINALRKELIKTEMRVRRKNKFFQRLSAAGDKIFPRRKEMIKDLSNHFIDDVDAFIAVHFASEGIREPLFSLRDEIKSLQAVAKLMTLNTHAFTHTRLRLSECWDKIKVLEKERKHDRAQQKAIYKQNVEAVLQKIETFKEALKSEQISTAEANSQLDEISSFMRDVELGRDEIRFLRDQLNIARQPLVEMAKSEEEKRQDQERERVRLKQQIAVELRQEIDTLLRSANTYSAETLTAARDALLEKIQAAPVTKGEKQDYERLLKSLRDIISDKRENDLMTLSHDDREALLQLREVLKQRQDRRTEVKEQLELLRKAAGASGLDFVRAMEYNAQLNDDKERLEKMNQGIHEIEQKIRALAKKI